MDFLTYIHLYTEIAVNISLCLVYLSVVYSNLNLKR